MDAAGTTPKSPPSSPRNAGQDDLDLLKVVRIPFSE